MGYSKVTKLPCNAPNTIAAANEHWMIEEKSYGLICQTLVHMPTVMASTTTHPDVIGDGHHLYGSKLFAQLDIEMTGNGDINTIFETEIQISKCKQNGRPCEEFLLELDNLFSLLPATASYTDAKKNLILLSNCDKEYMQWIADRASVKTWKDIFTSLPSHAKALKVRQDMTSNNNNGEIIEIPKQNPEANMLTNLNDRLNKFEANLAKLNKTNNFRNKNVSNQANFRNKEEQSLSGSKRKIGNKFRKGIICHHCKKEGHFQRDCFKKTKKE